uniref:Uncharacterized protein n=1 Tax=Tanacetum cinerariifolium TaxID=118510 RepID=A0A699GKJ9_TANCI|nr:hypothetical protein [Tanacetum cinerariifolium]
MSSEYNNITLAIRNAKSKIVCVMCKLCLVTTNHDVCVLNYVNDMNSRADNQSVNVSKRENQKKHKANAKKLKVLGSKGSLASSTPSKPRTCLRWIPTGRIFTMFGKLTTSSKTKNESEKSVCDSASTSNPSKPSSKGFSNFTSLLGSENKGIVPTEMELVMEQTQQGTSHEVLVRHNAVQNDRIEVGQNAVQNLGKDYAKIIKNQSKPGNIGHKIGSLHQKPNQRAFFHNNQANKAKMSKDSNVVSGIANQYGNGNVVTAAAEGNGNGINGIQSTQEEFEFMAAADAYEETERVKVNCTSEDTLQQASTSGTQFDNASVYDSDGSTEISYDKAYNDMQQKIERLQAQLGDLKGKSSDTQCASNTVDPLSQKSKDENVSLEFQVLCYAKENAHIKTTYKNPFDSIKVTQAQTNSIIDSMQKQLYDTIYENAKLRAHLFDKVSKTKGTTKARLPVSMKSPEMTSPKMRETKAYKTYLGYAIGVTPPKKVRKFKKPTSPKLTIVSVSSEEPIRKPKRVKILSNKYTNAPTTGFVIRDTPVMSLSKKKEKVTVDKRKGINLLSEVELTEEAQYEEVRKNWDEDDNNNDHDLSSEGNDQESDNGDNNTQSDNKKGSNSEHETDENEMGSESDQEKNEEDIEDDEEEKDDEFVKTSSNSTDDEDETNEESKVENNAEGHEDKGMDYTTNQFDDDVDGRMNEPVNTDEGLIQKEDIPHTDAEIVSPMDVHIHHEVPSNQTHTLLTIPVSVITESSHVYTTVILQSLPSFALLPPQSTPTPPPTTEATNPLSTLPKFASVFQFNNRVSILEKEVVELKKDDLLNTQILPKEVSNFAPSMIKSMVTESLEHAVLAKESSQPKSTYEAAASLIDFELKKILIDKMDESKSYLTAIEHRECYEGLIKSYDLEKSLFLTYDKVYSLKRSQKEKDKDEDPSAGSDRRLKKRKTSKDAEPINEEPEFVVADFEMPQDQEENLGDEDEEPERKTLQQGPTQSWLMTLAATADKPSKTFDELMSTPIDFSAYIMNGLKITNLTQETLLGPAFKFLKGTRNNFAELENDFEECYKALSEKLDWDNPKGGDYPFDLTKPLPLLMKGKLQIIPVDYFFNNDLKYLQGGSSTMTYTTSTTKKNVAQYDLPGIEDMVPNI